ncbi:hypothetical protein [Phaeodactylibacter luteus]|uniref:hypothetical protein n=1 Tax=Phaeodactylibacter luteus TaxID=1564516 RepID=UPI00147856B5|nr:hypothetical protein [Phaeodactylibacter luteus]
MAMFAWGALPALDGGGQPDWFIFVDECGNVEVYDDGCNGAVQVYDEATGSSIIYGRQC